MVAHFSDSLKDGSYNMWHLRYFYYVFKTTHWIVTHLNTCMLVLRIDLQKTTQKCNFWVKWSYRVVHKKRPISLSISCLIIQSRYSQIFSTKLFHNDEHFTHSLLKYGSYTHIKFWQYSCNHDMYYSCNHADIFVISHHMLVIKASRIQLWSPNYWESWWT